MENREVEVFFTGVGCGEWILGGRGARGREGEREGGRAGGFWKGGRWEDSAGKGGEAEVFWSGKVVMEGEGGFSKWVRVFL